MVDLLSQAVIVGGLDDWMGDMRPIAEERLVAKLQGFLGVPALKLYAPPIDAQDPTAPRSGITAWLFPEWFVAQYEEAWGEQFRSRPLLHRESLVGGKYLSRDKKKFPVIPIRFVQACINGHIGDIDWHAYAHGQANPCRNSLWLDERGTSGDLADVFVRCECGKTRSLASAARLSEKALGHCKGQRPWLGMASQEKCGGEAGPAELNRLLVRSASNAYFAQVLSVISIPDRDALLRKAVDAVWDDFLQYVESQDDLVKERKKAKVHAALEGFSDGVVFTEIQRRQKGVPETKRSIKRDEIAMLMASPDELGEDAPDSDFYARTLPLAAKAGPLAAVDRVVLVHRLREVVAQVGFTRFEAATPDIDGELNLDVRRADLAREVSWVPAVENRGEGIFIAFKRDAVSAWLKMTGVQNRGRQLLDGFQAWEKAHPGAHVVFSGLPYLFLHSLSHLLITAVSLECGYAASSIRERIYASDAGYGILLHTGTPDAEGTLGGLVQVGRGIDRHLRNALELGRLCSNDPVCAQHRPDNVLEERFLHGAACHGCLLIAETSCERRNELLDRALVVSTVEGLGAEFFREDHS
jgi:hypothetical protein